MNYKDPKILSYTILTLALAFSVSSCGDGDNGTGPDPDPPSNPDAPEISSFSPDSGEVGDEVVIYGSKFSATADDNEVSFNGTEADVSDASEDSLVTSVPEGATDGSIEVTVDGQSASSSSDFDVLSDEGNGDGNSIAQAVRDDDQLSLLADYLEGTELEATLEGSGSYTLLAPVDDVLESLSGLSDEQIEEVLSYHVIEEDVSSGTLSSGNQSFATVYGESVFVTDNGNRTEVNNNSEIVSGDIEVDNGRIHKVSEMLWPDAYLDVFEVTFKRYETNKFACTCVSGRTGLREVLKDEDNDFTIFAPSDEAFDSRSESVDDMSDEDLQALMNYHIINDEVLRSEDLSDGDTYTTRNGDDISISVSNSTVTINGNAVVETVNLDGTNGVVHIINTVLEP